ncbi:MAG: DUF1501 domain-containing protein [Planctomyces sp.]|jgi:hypothetical protein
MFHPNQKIDRFLPRRRHFLGAAGCGSLAFSMGSGLSFSAVKTPSPTSPANDAVAVSHQQPAGTSSDSGRARSCIILFLMGGADQHSTFDPKPDAPAEVRGEFGTISTVVPGMNLGELWPRTSLITDRLAILRAMSTGDNAHSSSGYYMLTGVPHLPMNAENVNPGFPNDHPNLGAVTRHFRTGRSQLPASIRLPHRIFNTDGSVWPGQDGGFLGKSVEPWLLNCQPADERDSIEEFQLSADLSDPRMIRRRHLLRDLGIAASGFSQSPAIMPWNQLTDNAFDVLSSPEAREAFDLSREAPGTRDRYGRGQFGQSVLMGRRLIEAGVSLVQVNWFRGPDEPVNAPCWDSHQMETPRLKNVLCPGADAAFSALIEDLSERGRLDETLVVLMTEFGRSPRMNAVAGRDHWGHVFSVVLAGGGIRGGVIHGASDAVGGYPADGRTTPQDLSATIFHCLGLSPDLEIHDPFDRPIRISRGEVIRPVLL